MEYRRLGTTGLRVSPLCLGTMQFGWTADEPLSFQILSEAFRAGINLIDTADIYSRWAPGNPGGVSEEMIGRWLRAHSIPRDQVILATKVQGPMGSGPNDRGLSRLHIINAVEASLRRLGTDYIDLYQCHWPDEHTPQEETLVALNDLVRAGKVRYTGCSNYPAWYLVHALWISDHRNLARFDCIQPHYSMVHRAEFERELAPACRQFGLGVIPYSPLAGGFLTGKYRRDSQPESARLGGARRYFNDRNWALLDKMDELGQTRGGFSVSQVALAWMLANPLITSPIIGPRTLDQLHDNLGALNLLLTTEEKSSLDEASSWQS